MYIVSQFIWNILLERKNIKGEDRFLWVFIYLFVWFLSVFFFSKKSWGIHNIMAFNLFEMTQGSGAEKKQYSQENKNLK